MARKQELKDDDEWRSASGIHHQLCIVEELDPEATQSAHAIVTFGGFSLCRGHFTTITELIKAGMPMGEVVHTMMTVGLSTSD